MGKVQDGHAFTPMCVRFFLGDPFALEMESGALLQAFYGLHNALRVADSDGDEDVPAARAGLFHVLRDIRVDFEDRLNRHQETGVQASGGVIVIWFV